MNYGNMLLSKVIDGNDVSVFNKYAIDISHFSTKGEKETFDFIQKYAANNKNQTPSYATVVSECNEFEYVPQVEDSFTFLVKQVKSHKAKIEIKDFIEQEFVDAFTNESDGNKLADLLISHANRVKMRTDVLDVIGTSLKTDTQAFLDEYKRRKSGESFKIWKSKFATINNEVGGYLSGNMYSWYGRSGRGKSVFTMEEALEAATQGARVLVWAMEMSRFEWMARAYSSLSARQGIIDANIEGVNYDVGFENRALLTGKLSEEFESGFEVFLLSLNESLKGEIILRAADDVDFHKRDVAQLESDIHQTKADVVVVDPIYLMDFEANTARVAGGDVANTSKKIRRMAGLTGTVIHVITQAEEVRDDTDEEGNRELRAPKRAEIKKTKAVLEDAANTFGIDTLDGQGLIEIGKSRNSSSEGAQVEVLYMPNYGLVRELETGQAAASQFDF